MLLMLNPQTPTALKNEIPIANLGGQTMSQPLRETLSSQVEQQLREANDGVDPITHVDMARVRINIGTILPFRVW
jgi:hypothetical protein